MFTIEKINETIRLSGHIDSSNALQAESVILSLAAENTADALILDAENLEYISSAGLRIILRLLKSGKKPKLINVSSSVFEILETTGFTEMMPVEKRYRVISIDGCDIIGRGSNGIVYRIDPDTIVKVYNDVNALNDMQRDREVARRAFILGIPTAIPYDIVRVDNKYGAVFELLNAESITSLIMNDPAHMSMHVKTFIDLLKSIHTTECQKDDFPSMKAVAIGWAHDLEFALPADKWTKLCRLTEAISDPVTMLHGDYHTGNVLVQNGEALLIDMETISWGNPIFELASMFNAFVGFGEADHTNTLNFLGMPYENAYDVWIECLNRYFPGKDPSYIGKVTEKAMILGYMRILRRALRREKDTALGKKRIALCTDRLNELLCKVDSLDF